LFVFFSDPDGNRWAVQQIVARDWHDLAEDEGVSSCMKVLVDLTRQLSNLREAVLRLTEELDRRRYRTAERPW